MQNRSQIDFLTATVFLTAAAPAFGGTWYAKPTATGSGNCSSWANACTLPQAVAAATGSAGNIGHVWARKGTYELTEAIRLKDYVKIIGGFNGNETQASQSKPFANLTILHGGGGTDPTECGEVPLPIVYSKGNNQSAEFRGFVLENGDAPGFEYTWCGGGALLMIDSAPIISHCIFRNNFAWVGGAIAAYGDGFRPVISHCIFHDNGKYEIGTDPVTGQPIYQHNFAGAYEVNCAAPQVNIWIFRTGTNSALEGGRVSPLPTSRDSLCHPPPVGHRS